MVKEKYTSVVWIVPMNVANVLTKGLASIMPILLRTAGSRCEHITHTVCSLVTDGLTMCNRERRLACSGHIYNEHYALWNIYESQYPLRKVLTQNQSQNTNQCVSLQCFLIDVRQFRYRFMDFSHEKQEMMTKRHELEVMMYGHTI